MGESQNRKMGSLSSRPWFSNWLGGLWAPTLTQTTASSKAEDFILTHSEVAVVQSLSHVQLFATPWTAACQASLSFTISRSLLKLMYIESVMPSNQLIFSHSLFLLPSIFPSIRVFSNEAAHHIKWPMYWSFTSTSVLPINIQDWVPFGLTGWISLQSKGL